MNLTKVSFPIKCCIPKTALETSVHFSSLFPHFFNKAASLSDPVERMKYVISGLVASFSWT